MKLLREALLAATFTTLTGCASMMSGTTQVISIDSVPSGATVYTAARDRQGNLVGKAAVGTTPANVTVARKDGVIILEKEGFQTVDVQMERSMNPWVWGDIVLTSLLSTSIDTSTGASNEFDPGEYTVELVAE